MSTTRVAVVDDSSFVRKALRKILGADPRLEVVGAAASGEELIDHLDDWAADVITLDLAMPGMGGLRTLDVIREQRPTPVLVLSSHARNEAPLAIEALHRGAIEIVDKQSYSLVDFSALGEVLSEKILHLAGVEMPLPDPPGLPTYESELPPPPVDRGPFDVMLVGASTGGPLAVQKVLGDLGASTRVPIVVVQHMPAGFTAPFAERLDHQLPLSVREAKDREELAPGTAYVAPAGRHLHIIRSRDRLECRLADDPSGPHRPSVDELFRSAADTVGARSLAVLLTGMGRDGAEGMSVLRLAGAHTVAQDEATSVVFGMPRAAQELGAAREVLPLAEIGPRARRLLRPGAL